jgi:hypothetical protein
VSARFVRRDGMLVARLSEPERELLQRLPDELRGAYESTDPADEVHGRLFPRAYLDPTEESAEAEWQDLVFPDLLRERLDALTRVVQALETAEPGSRGERVLRLGPDDVPALLGVLNDARLALGTRLDVQEDTDLGDFDEDQADAYGYMVYAWLTQLEGDLVDTLLGELPE